LKGKQGATVGKMMKKGVTVRRKSRQAAHLRILITGRWADGRSALELFLKRRPGLVVVAQADDIRTLLTRAEATQPDVILLDWDLCDRWPEILISALHLLVESRPRVIVINVAPESKQAALAAGADGFVLWEDPPKRLLTAIETAGSKPEDVADYHKCKGEA
jgi:DNA-binding NarL/FixJ family response regulator